MASGTPTSCTLSIHNYVIRFYGITVALPSKVPKPTHDPMNIFIAGATGTLGRPLVRTLVARNHHVTGLTRSPEKREVLEAAGATPAVADALDPEALERAVRAAAPDCVVHALTALPKNGPMRAAHMEATNELRAQGTANLLSAATAADARRFVAESMIFAYGFGPHDPVSKTETDAVREKESKEWLQPTVDAICSLEAQLRTAHEDGRIETVALRYGLFYGAESPSTRYMLRMLRKRFLPTVRGAEGATSWIHLDDAVAATVAAIERGHSGEVYNVVDDEPVSMNAWIRRAAEAIGAPTPWSIPHWLLRVTAPYLAAMSATQLPVSNEKVKSELDWTPQYATTREGLCEVAGRLQQAA